MCGFAYGVGRSCMNIGLRFIRFATFAPTARIVCVGGYAWGVAPGYKLLRFQRVLRAETLPPRPKYLRPPQRHPKKMKRPTFKLLMAAPSSLMTAPGNAKVCLRDLGDGFHVFNSPYKHSV